MLEVFKNYAALIYNFVPKMEIGKALKMAGIISRNPVHASLFEPDRDRSVRT